MKAKKSKIKRIPETEKALSKALKSAKTMEAMLKSWSYAFPGASKEFTNEILKLNKKGFSNFIEKKPHMWVEYAQRPFYDLIDRGVLDPKTRELICAGIMMSQHRVGGTISHMLMAMCNGATEEEIMEVAFLTCYVTPKIQMTAINDALSEGFRLAKVMKKK